MKQKHFLLAVCFCLVMLSHACQTAFKNNNPSFPSLPRGEGGISYSLIYMIHGDDSYLYHDANGTPHYADKRMVAQAISVAEKAFQAEVFIFHQKSKKRFFFFIPLKESEFYYYRAGKLITKKSYFRTRQSGAFEAEAQLLVKHRIQNKHIEGYTIPKNILLYFGHQIPEADGRNYHKSYPDKPFTTNHFAEGMERLYASLPNGQGKFDITVLSTCYNGSPGALMGLSPLSYYVVASPENLHLSYLDTQIFENLDEVGELSSHDLALKLAEESFKKLSKNAQTEIAISVYDTEKVAPFLYEINAYTDAANSDTLSLSGGIEAAPYDCLENPLFNTLQINTGVHTFYRPPRFGKRKNKKNILGGHVGSNK